MLHKAQRLMRAGRALLNAPRRIEAVARQVTALAEQHAGELASQKAAMQAETSRLLEQLVLAAARNLATSGDHRQVPAFEQRAGTDAPARPLRIGLFDNLANQAYITARALRRLGHQVDVVIQENGFDIYPMARPQWEECSVENVSPSDFDATGLDFVVPDFVHYVPYAPELHTRYAGRPDAAAEVAALYKDTFGQTLADDAAIVLAQNMAQWNYIRAMANYDVVVLSMSAIMLGAFCPRPYVVCPLGGDLYIRAFDQDMTGLLFRAGFRKAAHLALPETDYFAYVDRLDTDTPRTFLPLLVDTDVYVSGHDEALRAEWKAKVGGKRFLLGVCRQDWDWKGSDKLIRAFARFHRTTEGQGWRLLLQAWGNDLERSRALVTEMGLDDATLWLTVCSKPLLRRRQKAADVVADQFVMEGYGASVLESMAAGKPVVMVPVPATSLHHFRSGPPPLVGARSEDEIAAALQSLQDDSHREAIGRASRAWVESEHGYRTLAPLYLHVMQQAIAFAEGKAERHSPDLLQGLRATHERRRAEVVRQWNRVLPLPDAVTDRWEKARFLGFGDGASIYDSAMVIGNVQVGRQSWIGPQCVLDGSGGLSIGATCSISAGVQIYSHDTVSWAVSGGTAPYRTQPTRIGDHVYIGPGAVISAGATIGDGSVIGALSFVKGDIPAHSFAVGTPARVIGRVIAGADGTLTIVRTDRTIQTEPAS